MNMTDSPEKLYTELIKRLESLDETSKTNTEISRQTLEEIRRIADSCSVRMDHFEKDMDRNWKTHGDEATSRAKIYEQIKQLHERINQLEVSCAKRHGNGNAAYSHGKLDAESWIGRKATLAWAVVISAILTGIGTHIVESFLRR